MLVNGNRVQLQRLFLNPVRTLPTRWNAILVRESFRRGLPGATLDRVLLLGAGGAGSAVGHAALGLGVKTLLLHDVEAARADRVARRLQLMFSSAVVSAAADVA